MKKNYNPFLMVFGVLILITQITVLVIHRDFGNPFIYPNIGIDTTILIVTGFLLIVQFKGFYKTTSLLLLGYFGIGTLYSLFADAIVMGIGISDIGMKMAFSLFIILGYILSTLALLLTILHIFHGRFEIKFTKVFVGTLLVVSTLLLVGATIVGSSSHIGDIIANSLAVVAIGVAAGASYLLVNTESQFVVVDKTNQAKQELERLFNNGIISQEEYEQRLSKFTK